jgi:hypothetical protein
MKLKNDIINKLTNGHIGIGIQTDLVSFPVFLKKRNFQAHARWQLLNICVKEVHPAGIGLDMMPKDDMVYR